MAGGPSLATDDELAIQAFKYCCLKDHAVVASITQSYRFTSPKTDESFILGWVDDQWFFENWDSLWSVLADVLRKVHDLFEDWSASPYAATHVPELFSLITTDQDRSKALRTPLDVAVDSEVAYWLLAPGEGANLWDECYERGIGTIGWDELGDLTQYASKEQVADAMPELYPDNGPKAVASMMWYFVDEIKPGDVIFAKHGLFKICGWGVVTGDYKFDASRQFHKHTLPVDWRSNEEVALPEGMQLSGKTLTPMTGKREFLDEMGIRYTGIPGLSEGESGGDDPPKVIQPYSKTERRWPTCSCRKISSTGLSSS